MSSATLVPTPSLPGSVRVTDYETVDGKPISTNRGPQCAKCGRPYKQCNCPPVVEVPGENATLESPATRQASSSEVSAFQAGKIEKHLARIADGLDKLIASLIQPTAVASDPLPELGPMGFAVPGVTEGGLPMPPVIDAEKLAANEAKKAETLARMKGVK